MNATAPNLVPKGFDYQGLPAEFTQNAKQRVSRIRNLDLQMGNNVFEMGRLLKDQREAFGSIDDKKLQRGAATWNSWVKNELGWSSGKQYANRLIQIYEKFGDGAESAPSIGFEAMRMLAADNADDLRKQVLDMAANGNTPTIAEIREMKKEAAGDKRPTPTEAKEKAKATGEVVIGSDDKFYTPLPEEKERDYQERMSLTYETIDAVNLIAATGVAPDRWLSQAEPHWLNDFNLGHVEDAIIWLQSLAEVYKKENGIVDNGK